MKVNKTGRDFVPHPEYQGQGVIVDVTELKEMQTNFGKREVFRVVIETHELNEEGKHCCVWSAPFTPSLHEKAAFRKFLKGILGRDLTKAEIENGFETEDLIGMNVFVVITHAEEGDKTYANIASATPWKGEGKMVPSGNYKRQKDRDTKKVEQPKPDDAAPAAAAGDTDPSKTVIHIGKHKGHEVRDVDPASLQKLVDMWLPNAKKLEKPTADDRRLIKALEWFVSEQAKATTKAADDEVPY